VPVAVLVFVCTDLCNVMTVIRRGNEVSALFRLNPPSLSEYLAPRRLVELGMRALALLATYSSLLAERQYIWVAVVRGRLAV
jgi:hypothetical protein